MTTCVAGRRYYKDFKLSDLKEKCVGYDYLVLGTRKGSEVDGARKPLVLGAVAPRNIVFVETDGNSTNEHNGVYW